jgi:prephenate dehydrogenase
MKILISGLGLIGGSMARAFKFYTEHKIIGYDINRDTARKALLVGACDYIFTDIPASGNISNDKILPEKINDSDVSLSDMDVIILAAYPAASMEFLKLYSHLIGKDTFVYDLGGTKRGVCKVGFEMAEKYGFTFVGGHPMAGTQFSGFEASYESLFKNANMLLVPHKDIDVRKLDFSVKLFKSIGFNTVKITNADDHDRIIAYTSQLAHVLSNAYVKSPTSREHSGYSAGSFRDLTRVAHLNARMWTELFMENRDNLVPEIELLANSLIEYAEAMKSGDSDRLERLLEDGRRINDEIKAIK